MIFYLTRQVSYIIWNSVTNFVIRHNIRNSDERRNFGNCWPNSNKDIVFSNRKVFDLGSILILKSMVISFTFYFFLLTSMSKQYQIIVLNHYGKITDFPCYFYQNDIDISTNHQ